MVVSEQPELWNRAGDGIYGGANNGGRPGSGGMATARVAGGGRGRQKQTAIA